MPHSGGIGGRLEDLALGPGLPRPGDDVSGGDGRAAAVRTSPRCNHEQAPILVHQRGPGVRGGQHGVHNDCEGRRIEGGGDDAGEVPLVIDDRPGQVDGPCSEGGRERRTDIQGVGVRIFLHDLEKIPLRKGPADKLLAV